MRGEKLVILTIHDMRFPVTLLWSNDSPFYSQLLINATLLGVTFSHPDITAMVDSVLKSNCCFHFSFEKVHPGNGSKLVTNKNIKILGVQPLGPPVADVLTNRPCAASVAARTPT